MPICCCGSVPTVLPQGHASGGSCSHLLPSRMRTLKNHCEKSTALAFSIVMLCAAPAAFCGGIRLAQVLSIFMQVLCQPVKHAQARQQCLQFMHVPTVIAHRMLTNLHAPTQCSNVTAVRVSSHCGGHCHFDSSGHHRANLHSRRLASNQVWRTASLDL